MPKNSKFQNNLKNYLLQIVPKNNYAIHLMILFEFWYESAKNMFYACNVLTILVDLGIEVDTYEFCCNGGMV